MGLVFFLFFLVLVSGCLLDTDCRNISNCNGVCQDSTCIVPLGPNYTVSCDNNTQVCYEFLGLCLSKCAVDGDCARIPYVLHFPNPGVCDGYGKCHDCLRNDDCNPWRNETCGSSCTFNSGTKEYLCKTPLPQLLGSMLFLTL